MAYLSNYLGGAQQKIPSTRSSYGSYALPRRYTPYSVPRRGVSGIAASNPFGGQDFSSALLQQRMVQKAAAPSTQFDSSYNYDPILAKIQALASESVANATTDASQLRNSALISTGLTSAGQGLGFGADTLAAAQANPESDYAQLQREYAQRAKDLEEAMSASNLLYSGEYDRQLAQLAQGKASAEGSIGQKLKDLLAGVDSGLLTAQETARQNELEARQAAELARHYTETGFQPGDMNDFRYGATLPPGVSDEQIYSLASGYAPTYGGQKYVPAHIMNQGQIQNGMIAIKYVDPTGKNPPDTIWIPLGALNPNNPTPHVLTPQEQQDAANAQAGPAGFSLSDLANMAAQNAANPLDYLLSGGNGAF